MTQLSTFAHFAKDNRIAPRTSGINTAVVYTRVSSKEQADTNLSLDIQRRIIDEYAQRSNIKVEA
ncbi:MAG: recombinase family protein, partial [Legionellales bacterium]